MTLYTSEVRFYRKSLGISYEYGSHLRKIGVLMPDALVDGSRPLFLISAESLEQHRYRIAYYRGTGEVYLRSKKNELVAA